MTEAGFGVFPQRLAPEDIDIDDIEGLDGFEAAHGGHASDSSRACALCHKPLTDAASVESGVGPVCRQRSNEALARAFPVRWGDALEMMQIAQDKGLISDAPVAVRRTLAAIASALLDDPDAPQREDWRAVIKQAEWVLSHTEIGGRVRCLLRDLAELLGYPATAALWRGEMVIGKATLTFEGGALHLRSPRPMPEVRDQLYADGWRYFGQDKAWRLRVRSDEGLAQAERRVRASFLRCDVTEAIGAAQQHLRAPSPPPKAPHLTPALSQTLAPTLAQAPAATASQAPSRAACWTKRGTKLRVRAPYLPAFIDDLKAAIPPRQRAWAPASSEWVIDDRFQDAVQALLRAHFPGSAPTPQEEADEAAHA